jgi:NAD(P)-dependent dehydrogenase (short-subunit alcohol dehydrogenase family)
VALVTPVGRHGVVAAGIFMASRYATAKEKIMNGRTVALVTGANKGIGRAIAEQLAGLGMTVLVGARDPRLGEAVAADLRAAGGDALTVALDVTDPATIRAAAALVEERFGRLDVLVNNAGITGSGTVAPQDAVNQLPSVVDLDTVRAVFETNVFGVIAVTNAMLPLLRRSAAPRVVNMSSTAASLTVMSSDQWRSAGLPQSGAYAPSKSALNALTVQYADELRKDGFLVNAAAPGFCATDANAHTGHLSPADGAAVVVRLATLGADGPTGGFFGQDGPVAW